MRSRPLVSFLFLFLSCQVRPGDVFAAPAAKDKIFLAEKREIILLASERARSVAFDYQKLLKMGEERIRGLHENYMVHGSTPPTRMDNDVQELRAAAQRVRLQGNRGVKTQSDPEVLDLIERHWSSYLIGFEGLLSELNSQRQAGVSESRLYWDLTARYARLRTESEMRLLGNAPQDILALEDAFRKDELALLKKLELTPRKTRGPGSCVVPPRNNPDSAPFDISPFYYSQGVLPQIRPRETGAFSVPEGCRTVTRRESGINLIVRVSEGKGIVYIGSSEKKLDYGYTMIPADAAYYFENISGQPLRLEYVAVPAS
jgi:hypothetical protein